VALAILGATFTVLLAAHTAASRQEARARRLFEATALAREVLTRTEVEGKLPPFGKDDGVFGDAYPGYRWERQVSPVEGLPFTDLKEVVVRVLWPEGEQTRSTEVVFYFLEKD
jgi:hypothetical protein